MPSTCLKSEDHFLVSALKINKPQENMEQLKSEGEGLPLQWEMSWEMSLNGSNSSDNF